MSALFLFLFKVNIALVLFCAGYYLVLRHLTFYTLNRIYLVAAIIFSTIYPKINLSDFVQRHQQLAKPVQTVILNWEAPAKNLLYQPNYWQWVEVIFWAGVILFAARMVMQLLSLLRLYRRSQPGQIDEHNVRLLKDDVGPFSFWRSVYVNPTKLSPAELKNVLQHEQVHVSQWHTLDLLLAELSTIFYWFNPGVWLMKKAVRENLEFITDRKILQKGADSKEYQYSLVSVSLAAMPNTIVNHFNISTIKKRIIMMNAKRSSGYKLTRYVFLIPAVVILLLTFSLSKAEVARYTFKNIATAIGKVAIVGGSDRPEKKPITSSNASIKAKVSVKKMIAGSDTIYSGKTKNGGKSFLVMSDTKADSVNYVLNGQKSSKEEIKALDPGRIKSIELLDAKAAKEFYSELDNDRRVMFVTTEDSEVGKKLKEKMDKAMGDGVLAKVHNVSVNGSPDIVPPPPPPGGTAMTYTITSDNKSSDVLAEETNDSKNVSTVIVTDVAPRANVKTATTVKKNFHIMAKPSNDIVITAKPNTDFLVTSDEAPATVKVERFDKVTPLNGKPMKVYFNKLNTSNDQLTIDGEGQPLFIIDGKEAKSLKNVSAADIKSITVLKNGSAEKQYGEKGKNGVVVITTKKGK